MGKAHKIRTSETPHHIPHYKRSVGEQSSLRNQKRLPGRKTDTGRTSYLLSFAAFIFMLLFIGYWIIPWERLADFGAGLRELTSSSFSDEPLLHHSFSQSAPVFSDFDDDAGNRNFLILFKVMSGDSLRSLLQRYGVPTESASAAQNALADFKNEQSITNVMKANDLLEGQFNQDGDLFSIKIRLPGEEYLEISQTTDEKFIATKSRIVTEVRERIVMGTISSSFAAAATKSGLGYDMVDDLVDIFSDRISFHRDFRKGDRFSLIYQEHEQVGESGSTSGPILAAALEVKGKHYTAIRYVGADGKARYFNEDGALIGNTFLRYPLKFSRISSHFSDGRMHPVLKVKRPHNGVDFAAPTGTPVRTVGDGIVTFAGRKGGHGIMIEIKHSDRFTTGYSHLSAISPGIVRGKRVAMGTVIGKVGMTGLATGPHLHFSLYDRGKYVDPLKAKLPKAEELRPDIRISPTYLERAKYTLEHYQKIANNRVLQ